MAEFTTGEPVRSVDVVLKGLTSDDLAALELILKHGPDAVQSLPLAEDGAKKAEPILSPKQVQFASQFRTHVAHARGILGRK